VSPPRTREMAGLAAVGIGVCCGLPVVLGAGGVGTATGIVSGSSLVAAVGLAVGALGLLRWHRRRSCPTEHSTESLPAKPSGGP